MLQINFLVTGVYPMHFKDNRFVKTTFILMIAAFTVAGCGGRLFTYKGYKVTQNDFMVQLKDGNQQGVWKTNELAIKYQYQMTLDTLKIAGTNELVGGFAIGPNIVHRLAVYLLFLDNQGIVIENVLIHAGDYDGSIPLPMEFERTIPIPEGALTISFAYDGVVPGEYTIGFSPSRQ